MNGFLAMAIVLGVVGALAYLVRSAPMAKFIANGPLAKFMAKNRPVAVEIAIPLGERRSLVIVTVEGRRLLLGMTPTTVSLVTELRAGVPAPEPRFEVQP
jgi:flagellar biogenesis protein FliO